MVKKDNRDFIHMKLTLECILRVHGGERKKGGEEWLEKLVGREPDFPYVKIGLFLWKLVE